MKNVDYVDEIDRKKQAQAKLKAIAAMQLDEIIAIGTVDAGKSVRFGAFQDATEDEHSLDDDKVEVFVTAYVNGAAANAPQVVRTVIELKEDNGPTKSVATAYYENGSGLGTIATSASGGCFATGAFTLSSFVPGGSGEMFYIIRRGRS